MTSMKRRTAIAVGVGLWIGGLGSAGALTYDLSRTLPLAGATSQPAAPISASGAAFAAPVSERQPVIYVPTITIVAQGPRRSAVVGDPKPAKEIGQMQCADWRELDMGSGRVQVCE
jgi:hypothetical protein